MAKLLLNGADMPEKEFYLKFKEIVGCEFEKWIGKENTSSYGDSETYEWTDKYYTLGGCAYAPPKLYKKQITPIVSEKKQNIQG